MINKPNKNQIRQKRHKRVRGKISGTPEVPRLNVYRSLSHIYVQLVDDTKRHTIVASSSIAKGLSLDGKKKTESAKLVGADIAKKAQEKGITKVVFDRGGYIYTGRIKAVADGAREAGLIF